METIELTVGGTSVLTLPGLGSAGYQWFVTLSDDAVADITLCTVDASLPPGSQGSRDEHFVVTALRPGEAVAHFVQRRVFQPEALAHAQHDIIIRVKDD